MSDCTASDWFREGERLRQSGHDEEALAAYEQGLRLDPSNLFAIPVLELRSKLLHPLAPAGHFSAELLKNLDNGPFAWRSAWRNQSLPQGAILAGQQGSYQIFEPLGDDDFIVRNYLALDLAHDRPVVVKLLDSVVILVYFALVAPQRLTWSDPHLEQLLDFGLREDCGYLVTEYGQTLRMQMAAEAPFAIERACDFAAQIASGLDALWQQGITHGGLTPATILVTSDQQMKLTDMGLIPALNLVQSHRVIGGDSFLGNPSYVAPEYVRGDSRKAEILADLYSLACIFFEMLSGHPPYQGKTPVDVAVAHIRSPIPSIVALRPELPPTFDTIFQKALAKQPDERYQTPQTLLQALNVLRYRS